MGLDLNFSLWAKVVGFFTQTFFRNNRRYSGTYLPHVATEQGWTKMETLESLARKAGYRGQIDRRLIDQIHVVRYQSQTITFSYQEFLNLKN